EFFRGYAGDASERLQLLPAAHHRVHDLAHDAAHGGAARLRADTEAGHGASQAKHLGLAQADELAGASEAHAHEGDLALCRGEVVAEVDDGACEPVDV